jgi:PRC-barrel domain protein
MEDLGPPVAYLALEDGTPVYDRSGERVGVVEHVLGDMRADVFDGVIVHTKPLPGKHLFADLDQIAELRERGVVLSVGRDELHEPDDRKRDPGSTPLEARLRRAWDWVSGRR